MYSMFTEELLCCSHAYWSSDADVHRESYYVVTMLTFELSCSTVEIDTEEICC